MAKKNQGNQSPGRSHNDIIPRIQEMLREKSEETGLDNNAATAVAVSQLLLPVMGLSSRNIDKRLDKQETAIISCERQCVSIHMKMTAFNSIPEERIFVYRV